jgi:protein-S-isoprenylcysteine O-methyltransferase Ste14
MLDKVRGAVTPSNLLRSCLLLTALSTLLFVDEFVEHTRAHFSGFIKDTMITGQWHIVALNIAFFVSFLVPLTFRRKADWREYGLVVAFFVSLFIEMYGVPFILLFTAGYLQPLAPEEVGSALELKFLGVEFSFTVPMVYGSLLIIIGSVLVIVGWVTLYRRVGEEGLVTSGIYSVSRNPQYLGFILMVTGWLVGWPTILVVVFAPVLIVMYVRLCKKEEGELDHLPGFESYREEVPLIV